MNAFSASLQSEASRVTAGWRACPDIHVVDSTDDLPVRMSYDTQAAYAKGAAWLVAENLSPEKVPAMVGHEVIAHHGLRNLFGKKYWYGFMNSVQDGAGSDERIIAIRESVRCIYVDDSGDQYLTRVSEADEVAAATAENLIDPKSGRLNVKNPFRSWVSAMSNWFARDVLYLQRPTNLQIIEGTLLEVEHRLRYGGACFGLGKRIQDWYASSMSKPVPIDRPAMTIRESENLLRAEDARLHENKERKFFWDIIGYGLLFTICTVFIIWGAFDFFIMIGKAFH